MCVWAVAFVQKWSAIVYLGISQEKAHQHDPSNTWHNQWPRRWADEWIVSKNWWHGGDLSEMVGWGFAMIFRGNDNKWGSLKRQQRWSRKVEMADSNGVIIIGKDWLWVSYWGGNRSGENLNCDAEKRDATAASRASSSSSAVKNEEKGGKRQMEIEREREIRCW